MIKKKNDEVLQHTDFAEDYAFVAQDEQEIPTMRTESFKTLLEQRAWTIEKVD